MADCLCPRLSREHAPPPLDLRFMAVPYNPSWDVLRRMCESVRVDERAANCPPSVEHVLDMGSFDDNDDESLLGDEYSYSGERGQPASLSTLKLTELAICATSGSRSRLVPLGAFACVLLLLAVTFRVNIPLAPFRFVRERI